MIAICGKSGVQQSYRHNNEKFISSIGSNTGNLVFQYAIWNLLSEDKVYIGDMSIDNINNKCSHFIVPSANFIRENSDMSSFVNYLKQVKIPLVFLGLGAQGLDYASKPLSLHKSIQDLLALIKDRGEVVGVRGYYSQEILEFYGITNSIVIGCPSNFINNDVNLYNILQHKWNKQAQNIAIVPNEPWPKQELNKLTEIKLFELSYRYPGLYIQQSVEPIIQLIRSNNSYSNLNNAQDDLRPKTLGLHGALAPTMTLDMFTTNFYNKARLYISVDQWMEDISKMDFCCGTRIHGNIVAYQAGCPSVVIHHDARTQELAEIMEYPRISMESFVKCDNIEDIKNMAIVDFDKHEYQKNILKHNFIELLTHYQLKHNL